MDYEGSDGLRRICSNTTGGCICIHMAAKRHNQATCRAPKSQLKITTLKKCRVERKPRIMYTYGGNRKQNCQNGFEDRSSGSIQVNISRPARGCVSTYYVPDRSYVNHNKRQSIRWPKKKISHYYCFDQTGSGFDNALTAPHASTYTPDR